MKIQTGIKIYLWLSGAVLPLWLMNHYIGQPGGVGFRAPQSQTFSEKNIGVQSAADRKQAMVLKLSYSLCDQSITKNIRVRPVGGQQETAALNKSFFLNQANAIEIGTTKATIEKKDSTRQSKERFNELALNIDKLSRQKLGQAHGDPFVAKLPPPPLPAPPPPPAVPVAPAFPYTYMGRMVENNTTTLFLTKQNQSYSLKLNTVLENVYRVDKIDNDQVIFTYLPLNVQQILYIGRAG